VVVFDNLRGTIKVVASVDVAGVDPNRAYDEACRKVDEIFDRLARPSRALPLLDVGAAAASALQPVARTSQADYQAAVRRIQEYIKAGDAFQVCSHSVSTWPATGGPVRRVSHHAGHNPSPYMFHLEFQSCRDRRLTEVLVRLDGRRVDVRPGGYAAPRPQRRGRRSPGKGTARGSQGAGRTRHADRPRPQRRGRVAAPGSVRLDDIMVVERYSHVMHLVSNVSGTLIDGLSAKDVVRATFPPARSRARQDSRYGNHRRAGTVSPWVYGGAVGYLSYTGNMDLAIAIRTLVTRARPCTCKPGRHRGRQPAEAEHEECVNKARAVIGAIELARQSAANGGASHVAGHR